MFLQKILVPDKSNFIIRLYHKSNKIIIPFLLPSVLLDESNDLKKYFDFFNINNLGFHSFVSFSIIVTDYHKKLPFINEKILRLANLKMHSFLVLFFSYNLYNKYYNVIEYNFNYLKRRETIPYL